eukprot:1184543-Prorocentrum_minimum.AAC.3
MYTIIYTLVYTVRFSSTDSVVRGAQPARCARDAPPVRVHGGGGPRGEEPALARSSKCQGYT